MMLKALLADLTAMPEVEVMTTRDARLPSGPVGAEVVWIDPEVEVWTVWASCIQACDAVWLVAPETDGILEKLSRMVVSQGKTLVGCAPDVVALAASKSNTSAALLSAGVQAVPTWRAVEEALASSAGPWVIKPDDGAGCEDTTYCSDAREMQLAFERVALRRSMVIQPFLPGIPASLSMLCRNGRAWLLSANRQDVRLTGHAFVYHGGELNGMAQHWHAFEALAGQIAHALPGLAGYVGVDVIVEDAGPVTVLEINPRLTTSYTAMRAATGVNPARLVLDLLYNDHFILPGTLQRHVVRVSLNETTPS